MSSPVCQHTKTFSHFDTENEKKTQYVLLLTLVTMAVEIVAGISYGSMALLADGWHMGTHAAAFCLTLFTYRFARKNSQNREYSYGTGKVGVLGGYTSAIGLGLVSLVMLVESFERLVNPLSIQFNEAILVAIVGLAVNVASMFLLGHHHHDHHHADHDHDHDHDAHHSDEHHHDHNLKAAYMHVLADALTSVAAIVALIVGKYLGWIWLDPIMGIVGSVLIARWAFGLIKQTAPTLLDQSIDSGYEQKIIDMLSNENTEITDLHIWRISANHFAATITLSSRESHSAAFFRDKLQGFDKLHHLTIEVNPG